MANVVKLSRYLKLALNIILSYLKRTGINKFLFSESSLAVSISLSTKNNKV